MSSSRLPAPAWPSVDVLVPVHGDRGGLQQTVDALMAQDYRGPVEIVIIDNGDNGDLSTITAGDSPLRVVHEAVPGSYAARNRGVLESVGEILAFTDGDCLPRPAWLREGVTALLEHDGPAFVGGAMRVFPADLESPTAAELWDCVNGLRQDRYVTDQGWAATANMLTRRTTFDEVGAFNSGLRSGGDREWGTRASSKGVAAVYCPAAVVDHPARRTLGELHTKVRRVTGGETALRKASGRPLFESGLIAGELRPNTRSIARRSREVSPSWTRDRVRYVVVAHWLQYYFLLSRLRHAARARGT